jgi:hypothetical protein
MEKKRTIKICFSGVFNTGKSWTAWALSRALAEQGKSVKLVKEGARIAHALGFGINQDATVESEVRILLLQVENEQATDGLYDYVISDRALWDSLPYIENNLLNCRYEKWGSNFELLNFFLLYIKEKMKYDFVFYCRPGLPIYKDGVRAIDPKYQKELDSILKNKIDELCITKYCNFHKLPSPEDLEKNLIFCMEKLGFPSENISLDTDIRNELLSVRQNK